MIRYAILQLAACEAAEFTVNATTSLTRVTDQNSEMDVDDIVDPVPGDDDDEADDDTTKFFLHRDAAGNSAAKKRVVPRLSAKKVAHRRLHEFNFYDLDHDRIGSANVVSDFLRVFEFFIALG